MPLDLPHPDLILYTDASDSGLGRLSQLRTPVRLVVSDLFSVFHRELLATFLAVERFLPLLCRQSVALFNVNSTALSYLRKEWGNTFCHSMRWPRRFFGYAKSIPSAFYPNSSQQIDCLADSQPELSNPRLRMDFVQGGVSGALSSVACDGRSLCHFSHPSSSGVLLSSGGPSAASTNAMLQPWDHLQAYAFPPFGLIPRLLAKVRPSLGLEMTLVAPF